ncbi:MarR family winged helix-turn-helix transcriptional regulator [Cellulomonas pakistanensis]|uniref:HTH-type transcriptional regulator MarR n=1 Tax=Cellulomonas pakistanensis TaxID=992287 RepID=A0A919PGY9_9CELL|nr:MarR family transcriptional regulator [Cellulomonas pakistanensis]GIG37967.1 putative HTH-type transcriptional regulator MarR [Cellulomonas pakistanensis]
MHTDQVAELAGELRVALATSTRRIRSRRGGADLPDPQFNVLAILLREGPLSPGALADAEHVQPPSMTRTVNALVELGLVRKSEHPTDGRQVVVSLTDAGEAEVRETRRRRDAWLAAQLAVLTPDERRTLADAAGLLRRIAAGTAG